MPRRPISMFARVLLAAVAVQAVALALRGGQPVEGAGAAADARARVCTVCGPLPVDE